MRSPEKVRPGRKWGRVISFTTAAMLLGGVSSGCASTGAINGKTTVDQFTEQFLDYQIGQQVTVSPIELDNLNLIPGNPEVTLYEKKKHGYNKKKGKRYVEVLMETAPKAHSYVLTLVLKTDLNQAQRELTTKKGASLSGITQYVTEINSSKVLGTVFVVTDLK